MMLVWSKRFLLYPGGKFAKLNNRISPEEIIAIPDFDQEYKESVSATADSFEDMVSECWHQGQ